MTAQPLDEREFRVLYQRLRDGNPWGPEDRRGALNHLMAEQVRAAAALVRTGRSVSLAAPVQTRPTRDGRDPARHEIIGPGAGGAADHGLDFGLDRIALNVHGDVDSHIDALSHVIFDRTLYNDVPGGSTEVIESSPLSIAVAADGIVGRGLLLDIPALRGVRWLEPGEQVMAEDLLAAERAQGVEMSAGDLLFIRVGHRARRDELGPWDAARHRAGLHPAALELLAERRIAVLGSDGNNDVAPSGVEGVDFPVHVLAINALGLHMLDYLQFEELLPLLAEEGRWSFLCVVAPLRVANGTGSPVNPIAIL
ncbi:cyclase family protein [Actinospica robiniae]|uniref:cyclase family protein n=1 Tax=Actinospica robiniae TaxID=304901 RepID=UPI00040A05D0|nr:cyclase family protein [Actinospica robiniae]